MQKELQEEIAGTLMAISVVSKSLAKKVMKVEEENKDHDKVSRHSKESKNLADSIEVLATDEQHGADVEVVRKPATKITFEDLRAVLAVLTRDGKQKEVKELITQYGAKKLSDVPEDKYQELLDEARKI